MDSKNNGLTLGAHAETMLEGAPPPGPEAMIGDRLEWAREQRNVERSELIRRTIGTNKRSSYTNIVKHNRTKSKAFPLFAKDLKISLRWLLTGEGQWDEEDATADDFDGDEKLNEKLLMLCHDASVLFAAKLVPDADVRPLELFTMTARLYEQAVKLDKSEWTEQNLGKLLFQHYTKAMRSR